MVALTSLWLPILLSAVFVFVASSVIHMVINYHASDHKGLPDEDKILAAIKAAKVPPGDYMFPHCKSRAEMSSAEMQEKMKQGPMGLFTLLPPGGPQMGTSLVLWFVYTLVVGVVTAYVTSRTLEASTHYLQVFRVAGTVAFLTYAGAEPVRSIWWKRSWVTTAKQVFDGLIYALLTAGAFGWLWPR